MLDLLISISLFFGVLFAASLPAYFWAKRDENWGFQDHHDSGIFCEKFSKIMLVIIIAIFGAMYYYNSFDFWIWNGLLMVIGIIAWWIGNMHWRIG